MKSADEIKKGLECCCNEDDCLSECPYFRNCDGDGFALERDALALIQHLQAENAENDGRIKQLEAERDAAINDLREADSIECDHCKHYKQDCIADCQTCKSPCACNDCYANSLWEWRGVQKEDSDA